MHILALIQQVDSIKQCSNVIPGEQTVNVIITTTDVMHELKVS